MTDLERLVLSRYIPFLPISAAALSGLCYGRLLQAAQLSIGIAVSERTGVYVGSGVDRHAEMRIRYKNEEQMAMPGFMRVGERSAGPSRRQAVDGNGTATGLRAWTVCTVAFP